MVDKESCYRNCRQGWRIFFVILNIFFLLIGLTLIGLGIWLVVSQNDFDFLTGTQYASGGVLIIIAGVITTIISAIGIVGGAGMWSGVLITYIVIMIVIVVLEIVAGILGFVFQDEIGDVAEERTLDAIRRYRVDNDTERENDVNNFIEFLQDRFDCCGFNNSDDWFDSVFFNDTMMFPPSCLCMPGTAAERCFEHPLTQQIIYSQACGDSLNDFLDDNLAAIAGIGTAVGVFELFGIGIAIGLCICVCKDRNKQDSADFKLAY